MSATTLWLICGSLSFLVSVLNFIGRQRIGPMVYANLVTAALCTVLVAGEAARQADLAILAAAWMWGFATVLRGVQVLRGDR